MKFGVFLPNGSNGYIPSAGSPVYLPTFEHNKAISVRSRAAGPRLRAVHDEIPRLRRGHGLLGTAASSRSPLMAAIAAVTDRVGLFPSISLLSQHPAYVARMVATIRRRQRRALPA